MSDQKHTVEDVLAQYAQTAEGAAHLAEIEQGKTKANTRKAPSVENVQTAQEHFAEQVADAKARLMCVGILTAPIWQSRA